MTFWDVLWISPSYYYHHHLTRQIKKSSSYWQTYNGLCGYFKPWLVTHTYWMTSTNYPYAQESFFLLKLSTYSGQYDCVRNLNSRFRTFIGFFHNSSVAHAHFYGRCNIYLWIYTALRVPKWTYFLLSVTSGYLGIYWDWFYTCKYYTTKNNC